MPYDEDFYRLYQDYLAEPGVRRAHDWVFRIARQHKALQQVVDFGCGRHLEYLTHGRPSYYVGIDRNAPVEQYPCCRRDDYRTMDLTSLPPLLTGFVSLFSAEITAFPWSNIQFYERVFAALPHLQMGLVAGFYYSDRPLQYQVEEAGGVTSFQTLMRPDRFPTRGYTTREIVQPVPSQLFGPRVWEVWRFLERSSS